MQATTNVQFLCDEVLCLSEKRLKDIKIYSFIATVVDGEGNREREREREREGGGGKKLMVDIYVKNIQETN